MKLTYGIACTVIDKKGRILLLKRSPDKKLFPGKWFVVGAYPLKRDDDMRKITQSELVDELGVNGKVVKEGKMFYMKLGNSSVGIKPFLAVLDSRLIKLNSEHTEYKWVSLEELGSYDLVTNTIEMIMDILHD